MGLHSSPGSTKGEVWGSALKPVSQKQPKPQGVTGGEQEGRVDPKRQAVSLPKRKPLSINPMESPSHTKRGGPHGNAGGCTPATGRN